MEQAELNIYLADKFIFDKTIPAHDFLKFKPQITIDLTRADKERIKNGLERNYPFDKHTEKRKEMFGDKGQDSLIVDIQSSKMKITEKGEILFLEFYSEIASYLND
jgi:hypothetical protein